ncbi:hypothetical protein BBW65_01940 [Helicobacter enhydrae]|uniref:Transport-associated OB type 1 domain-containing protein n=1 Tax=Helicobacter enhydrae TaxID=222136 RepID=A0A1B1U4K4_9HELI|nr:TOBE domain-containing protein [Helicobacter enhydrae]ANV97642.1 hypothetical protein BBW65_01940 [Helicobacter enhydrae]
MNQLKAQIISLQESENILFIKMSAQDYCFSAVGLGGDYVLWEQVDLCFKESDVMLAHPKSAGLISARNKFLSPILHIEHNGVLARVEFDVLETKVCALITYEALRELQVEQHDKFYWFVKSSDLIVQKRA